MFRLNGTSVTAWIAGVVVIAGLSYVVTRSAVRGKQMAGSSAKTVGN